jgi:hypothetical protein
VLGVLYALAEKGELPRDTVERAIRNLGVEPDKASPFFL